MTGNKQTYQVDHSFVDGYIKKANKRLFYIFFTTLVIVFSAQLFIIYKSASDAPLIPIFSVAISICFIAFFISVKLFNDKLRKFVGARYDIENGTVSQYTTDNIVRQFRFDEIAVVHKKSYGTIIVKGSGLTKMDYYRPKRSNPYSIDSVNVIFIPTITTNYSDLIARIKQLTK